MKIKQKEFIYMNQQLDRRGKSMKIYKNGICREIDPKRKQEFQQKGYNIEGEKQKNTMLQAENEKLKTELQELQAENEKLKIELQGGSEYADTDGKTENAKEVTKGKK